jgi:hypothetical protein
MVSFWFVTLYSLVEVYQTTRRINQENSRFDTRRRENLKFHKFNSR